jgi:hypothetical protein
MDQIEKKIRIKDKLSEMSNRNFSPLRSILQFLQQIYEKNRLETKLTKGYKTEEIFCLILQGLLKLTMQHKILIKTNHLVVLIS